jgi:hypothetical protein
MADDTQRIGISYTGFCLTALPHKRLADNLPWEKKGHRVTLLVEPGRLKHGGKTKPRLTHQTAMGQGIVMMACPGTKPIAASAPDACTAERVGRSGA